MERKWARDKVDAMVTLDESVRVRGKRSRAEVVSGKDAAEERAQWRYSRTVNKWTAVEGSPL